MPQAIGLAIAQFLFTVGAPLAVVNFFAIGGGGALVFGLGLSAISGLLRSTPSAPSIKPSDGQQQIRQSVPPRWKHYGRVRVAGPVFWWDADSPNDIFYLGLMLNHGPIDAIEAYFIDQNEVTIDGSGNVTTAPYDTVTTKFLSRLGVATETAYSELDTAFGYDNVRGDGVATLLGLFEAFANSEDQFENYPSSRPNPKVTIRASVCFDPREASHDREDPTTWTWSENWAVCFLNWLIDPDGLAIPWARIEPNLDDLKAQMDICDEDVLSVAAADQEKLYRVAATYLLTQPPKEIMAQWLASADARCWQKRDGTVTFEVGRFTEPTVRIESRNIVGYDMTRGQEPLTAVAGVRAQYRSSQHDYREQDAEPWPDGSTVANLGEDRVANLDLTWAPSHSQARRLMKRHAVRTAAPWRGTVHTNIAGLAALDQRYVAIAIAELGIDRSFEVESFRFDPTTMRCELDVTAVDASIDEWSPAVEEGTAPTVPEGLVWVSKSLGTIFGDNFNDRPKAFDGNSGSPASTGSDNGSIGKTWPAAKRFGKAIVYGRPNGGFVGDNPQVTLRIRGKNGAAPVNHADGTVLATLTFDDTNNESAGRELLSTDLVTAWDHWFVQISKGGGEEMFIAEIDWWEQT